MKAWAARQPGATAKETGTPSGRLIATTARAARASATTAATATATATATRAADATATAGATAALDTTGWRSLAGELLSACLELLCVRLTAQPRDQPARGRAIGLVGGLFWRFVHQITSVCRSQPVRLATTVAAWLRDS